MILIFLEIDFYVGWTWLSWRSMLNSFVSISTDQMGLIFQNTHWPGPRKQDNPGFILRPTTSDLRFVHLTPNSRPFFIISSIQMGLIFQNTHWPDPRKQDNPGFILRPITSDLRFVIHGHFRSWAVLGEVQNIKLCFC